MKYHPRSLEKELADQARLLRVWNAWHQEQRDEALAGEHGAEVAQILSLLDPLELNSGSAAMLTASIQRVDWITIDYDVRLTLLREINQKIMRLRERAGLPPLDDSLPGQPDNVFRRIMQMMFAPSPPGAHPGSNQTKQRNSEQVKYG
jgi:hypothetical protein